MMWLDQGPFPNVRWAVYLTVFLAPALAWTLFAVASGSPDWLGDLIRSDLPKSVKLDIFSGFAFFCLVIGALFWLCGRIYRAIWP